MKRILLFSFFLLGIILSLSAQRNCASMEVLENQLQNNPEQLERLEQIEAHTRNFAVQPGAARNVITIPVVVNVLYNTAAENVSLARIQSQIDVLNEDFRRTNADADNTWSQAADTEIEFCLATVDPNGDATDGIRRQSTTKRDWRTNDDMKKSNKGGIDPWDPSSYMNIWVCDIKGGILGYAQFPGGPPATDGIVIDYAYFGRGNGAQAPFDLGRTATHEVGHYLNLRHIWGDGPCSADDFVGDTPTSDGANYGCSTGTISCSSVDMVQNYMDYSDDACMNLYTNGQTTRMRALFSAGGARASLANSAGCNGGTPPADPTCDDGIQNGQETGVDCGGPDCVACPPVACDAPTGLGTSKRKGGREALLSWSAASGANSYFVEFRAQGASAWASTTTTATQVTATGLTSGNGYEFRVTSNCANGNTAISAIHQFTAGSNSRLANLNVLVYPNPVRDVLNIDLTELLSTSESITLETNAFASNQSETFVLTILDLTGRRVLSQQYTPGFDAITELMVGQLNNGIYFLSVSNTQGDVLSTSRFLVSH